MESKLPMNVSIDNSKYFISLDSLDLNLLPNIYRPRLKDKPVLLWQTKNKDLCKEEYLEFEIRSTSELSLEKESHGRLEIKDINSNKYPWTSCNQAHVMCHVCKILVPRAYSEEHEHSSKHLSYQKIVSTAVEREMNQKSVDGKMDEECRKKKSGANYFCEHCVSIIKAIDRDEHEKSKKHKNFAALDTFLNNFANFYTNSDKNVDENLSKIVNRECNGPDIYTSFVKVNKNSIVNVPINNNNEDININTTEDKSVIDNKLKEAMNLITNIETCIKNPCKEINNNITGEDNEEANIVNSLKQYIKLVKKYGTVKLEPFNSVDQDRIRVETQDGSELVVSVNNFHGFKRTGKKYVQCKMCNLFVSNVNDHIVSEKHMKIVAQPFEDKHCLRKLTNALSHCVVCNEVIDNPAVHILFNEHSKKLEQTLVPKVDKLKTLMEQLSTKEVIQETPVTESVKSEVTARSGNLNNNFKAFKTEDTDSNETNSDVEEENTKQNNYNQHFCSTCNKYMHVNNIKTHNSGTNHLMNSKTVNNYLMERCKNGFKCKICETNIQIFTWAVDDHITSPEHVISYYKFLTENKINQTKHGFFCKPCAKTLPRSFEIIHAATQSHKIKLASFNINYIASIDQHKVKDNLLRVDNDVQSSNCGDNLNVNTHLNTKPASNLEIQGLNNVLSTEHLSNENAKAIKTKANLNDTYQCEACNETIVNDPERIKLHNESVNHKIMHELLSKVNNLLEELLKYFNNPPETHYHLERTNVENELKCKVCSGKVEIKNAEKHINCLKHVHNHRSLMDVNKLKIKDDIYICHVCNVYVEIGKELQHIHTKVHEERMESLRNGDYVLVTITTKKLIEKISNDLKVVESQKGYPKAKDLELEDFIPCKKHVELKGDSGHYNHFSNLIDSDGELICVLCQVVITDTNEDITSHIINSDHQSNYNDVMVYNQTFQIKTGFVCGYCECTFVDNEFAHILSSQHEENFRNDPKKNFCFKCNISTIGVDVKQHLTSPQHIKAVHGDTFRYCNICNIKLTNSSSNIQRHVDGFQHKNNCFVIEQNRVILKNKKCFCQVCENDFNRDSLEEHITSSYHLMLLGEDY